MLLLNLATIGGCSIVDSTTQDQYRQAVDQQDAVIAIQALQAGYLWRYDQMINREDERPSADAIVDELFVDGGEWISRLEGQATRYRGKQQLSEMFTEVENRYTDQPGHYAKHFSMNSRIEFIDNRAINTESFLVLHTDTDAGESFWVVGHYIDIVTRNTEGNWRFLSKTAVIEDVTSWPSSRGLRLK